MDAKAVVAEEVGVRSCGTVHAREPKRDCFSISKARRCASETVRGSNKFKIF